MILDIWNKEYPIAFNLEKSTDFDHFINQFDDKVHFVCFNESKEVVGWLMTFNRDDEYWFIMLVSRKYQKKGIGSKLLSAAKENLDHLNGWVIDHNRDALKSGENYTSPLSFYLKNDFLLVPNVIINNEKLEGVKVNWTKKR